MARAVSLQKLARRPINQRGVSIVTSPMNIARLEQRYQVLELRKRGNTIAQIGQMLGIDPAAVRERLVEVLKFAVEKLSESVQENRQLQIERLDGLLNSYYDVATEVLTTEDGTLMPQSMAAAQLVLQIEARRAKLLALDAPENRGSEVSGIREYIGVDMDKV